MHYNAHNVLTYVVRELSSLLLLSEIFQGWKHYSSKDSSQVGYLSPSLSLSLSLIENPDSRKICQPSHRAFFSKYTVQQYNLQLCCNVLYCRYIHSVCPHFRSLYSPLFALNGLGFRKLHIQSFGGTGSPHKSLPAICCYILHEMVGQGTFCGNKILFIQKTS